MRSTRLATPLTALILGALAGAAQAAPPQILDRAPADAEVVVAVRQVSDLLTDIDQINRLLGEQADPGMMFAVAMVRGMPGLNLDGAAAFVIDLPANPDAMETPTVIALLPVADFDALTQGRAADNGVVLLPVPDSQVFARDLGDGYAAVSDDADAVRNFDAAKGRLAGHAARIGAAGARLVSDAEVSIITNADALRPMLNQGLEGLRQQGQMVAMMGGEQAAAGFNAFAAIADMTVRDLNAGVLGMSINDQGMTYDMAMQFKPESETAAYFTAKGATAGLLEKLPAQGYLVAGALDTSSPTVGKIATAFDAWAKAQPDAEASGFGQMSLAQLHELTSGVSFVMGTPPGLMGGGIFSNTTQYIKSSNPGAYTKAIVDVLEQADGQTNQGVTVDTTITANAVTIEDTPLTSFAMAMQVDPQAAQAMGGGMPGMDPAMVMQMVFGPAGGPAGYLAEVDGGVVHTLTQGPDLTRRALAAAKGGQGLGSNDRVKRIGAKLQDNRIAELYIGADEILNTVGPMLMMFGVVPEFQPVDPMDPLALGLATDAGGITGRIHMPASTLAAIMKLIPEDAGGMGGQDGQNGGDEGFDF